MDIQVQEENEEESPLPDEAKLDEKYEEIDEKKPDSTDNKQSFSNLNMPSD